MHELFDEIVGQKNTKTILEKICNSRRVPHAFLFNGPEGVGKFFTAIQFSKAINSFTDAGKKDSINEKIHSLREPYIKIIMPLPRGRNETGDDNPTEKLTKDTLETINSEISKKVENPYHKINVENANNIKFNSIRDVKKFINLEYIN